MFSWGFGLVVSWWRRFSHRRGYSASSPVSSSRVYRFGM